MYWWKVEELAHEFREGTVSESERMKYLLAPLIVEIPMITVPIVEGWSPGLVAIAILLMIVVTVVGVRQCYKANARGDDRDFLGRFVCLSWPITIRLTVILAVPFAIAFELESQAKPVVAGAYLECALIVLIEIWYFAWIHRHLRRIAQRLGTATQAHH